MGGYVTKIYSRTLKTPNPPSWNQIGYGILYIILFQKLFIHNEDLAVLFQKWNSFNLSLKSRRTPPTCFALILSKPLRFAKDPKFFLCFACISQNILISNDFWRNKVCILLRLDTVDDVIVNTKTVLERFIPSFWPFSVTSQNSVQIY